MADKIISCKNISIAFEKKNILDHISFEITKGSITSLLGVSGSGKSTLLRFMAGLETSHSGIMTLRDMVTNKEASIIASPAERKISFMFQNYALFPHKTVLGNVLYADNHTAPQEEKHKEAIDILEEVGLKDHIDKYPHMLSGGEKQRLALARTLMQKTDLVFLDEPFSNLDARLRDHLRDEVLTLLRKKGKTIIMVTHDPNEAMLVSDQILYMRDGHIIQSGAPQELYLAPCDYKTALFFGAVNRISGKVTAQGLETTIGIFPIQNIHSNKAFLCLRHEAFEIGSKEHSQFKGILKSMSFSGVSYICTIDVQGLIIRALLPMSQMSGYVTGQEIYLNIKSEGLFVFPDDEC